MRDAAEGYGTRHERVLRACTLDNIRLAEHGKKDRCSLSFVRSFVRFSSLTEASLSVICKALNLLSRP